MSTGLFASCLFLGNFVGPTLSGFLVEQLDFPTASLIFWCFFLLIAALNSIDLVYHMRMGYSHKNYRDGYQNLDMQQLRQEG